MNLFKLVLAFLHLHLHYLPSLQLHSLILSKYKLLLSKLIKPFPLKELMLKHFNTSEHLIETVFTDSVKKIELLTGMFGCLFQEL